MNIYALSAGISVLVMVSHARAARIGMPEGARQWIELQSGQADPGTCPGVNSPQGGDCVGGVGSIPDPSPNYSLPCWPGSQTFGIATSAANRMTGASLGKQGSQGGGNTTFLYNSMVDTYTVQGPPGTEGQPIVVTFSVHVEGVHSVSLFTSTIYLGGGTAEFEMGTWFATTDPAHHEGFRVNGFDSTTFGRSELPFNNYGTTQPVVPFSFDVTATLTRTVGIPFDVAHGLNISGASYIQSWGGVPTTAVIDIDLPDGYSITSVLGWNDPDAPPPPCFGDADGDNQVNFADITEVLTHFGASGEPGIPGDADHDGSVNFADITDVLTHFGESCP